MANGCPLEAVVVKVSPLPLDAACYQRHMLHAEDRVWVEKNCYVDIWIETIHALGCEPRAVMPFTVALDFEGDQFTFFKPPHDELRDLYGIDVQELNCWRPLIDHAVEHLAAGKLISTEADAWWLPDTSGTDYRRQHTKSTIVISELDVEARRLGYFHNAGYFTLEGEDFARTFRLDVPPDPAFMPFFAELVRFDRLVRRPVSELRAMSQRLLVRHLARRPATNPIARFASRFASDLPELQQRGLPYYHAWAFGTVRQLGAASELMAVYLRWLDDRFAPAASEYDKISTGAKSFILKAARAVNTKKPFDGGPMFAEWAAAWEQAIALLA
ncbi:MAG: hypothetical protein JWO36_5045 [Myxococcales bacterium]|nr:hypothetical protein [Myxococcales bacterium]